MRPVPVKAAEEGTSTGVERDRGYSARASAAPERGDRWEPVEKDGICCR